MTGIMKLDLCSAHQQEENHSRFATHACDFCKLLKDWEDARVELSALRNKSPETDKTVFKEVPQPHYEIDCEMNTMSMLQFIMNDSAEILTNDEQSRIAEWFYSRYGNQIINVRE